MTGPDAAAYPAAGAPPAGDVPREALIRRVVTALGLHRACHLKACRRARACAGRHLPCHAALEDELRPILRSVIAHGWLAAEAAGEAPDIAPAARDDTLRFLAAERAAIARIETGEAEDDRSPHALWLRHVVAPHLRRKAGRGLPHDDGRPHDPDAKLPR